MKTNIGKISELDLSQLQDELERRYGPGVAQELIDQLRRLEGKNGRRIDYMTIKAWSEVLEACRTEARSALVKLRNNATERDEPMAASLDAHRFAKRWAAYRASMRVFSRLYGLAMAAYAVPLPTPERYAEPERLAA